ncbi:MAG: oligopeptide transporter, OPT family [Deltaproteobacteria bacterium]|nr:oligopeptide transporter, OPT family [Deltaproteobacteria bacterium]
MSAAAPDVAPESRAPQSATVDRVPEVADSGHSDHEPFIPASRDIPELTPIPLIVGALLGILFGASSMYLVLKVGLTVSASIPVAVLSITIFRAFSKVFGIRPATILENNITQTTGSAGESIAFGVGVTMPALLILGYNLEIGQVILVSVLGGILGILMMIPLRRALIVNEAKTLVYPEGTACAEVLIVGETGGTTAKTVFAGLGIGGLFALGYKAFCLFKDIPEKLFGKPYEGGNLSIEVAPELLGVGYIIGTRISMIMGAGGILSALVLMPAIKLFGSAATEPIYPATKLIRDMSADEIWHSYILYIGAGSVAAGGIISLFKSLPTIIGGAVRGMKSLSSTAKAVLPARTDRDLPMWIVGLGSVGLVLACTFAPSLKINMIGALLILVLGFLFVTVSSRLTGEVGSSSNPISGMTVATLLITSLIFFALGWVSPSYKVAALSIAAIVCIAISNGGTTSQDLKTGYLVGATPSRQQIGILVGSLSSAMVLGLVILALNDAGTVYAARSYPDVTFSQSDFDGKEPLRGPDARRDSGTYDVVRLREPRGSVPPGKYLVDPTGHVKYLEDPGINGGVSVRDNGEKVTAKFSAPKPVLMSFIIEGIMSQKLPWGLVLIGVFISIVLELCGLSALAFAVGVYLPLSTSTPIMVGGAVRWLGDKLGKKKLSEAEAESGPGVLFSSGLIAGASVAGTLVALFQIPEWGEKLLRFVNVGDRFPALVGSNALSLVLFAGLSGILWLVATERWLAPKADP